MSKKYILITGSLVALSFVSAVPVFAHDASSKAIHRSLKRDERPHLRGGMGRGVAGTVVSVSTNSIVLLGKDSKTYTIDATNAKIIGQGKTIGVADIKVGDTLLVHGTVSDSSVKAVSIIDEVFSKKDFGKRFRMKGHN